MQSAFFFVLVAWLLCPQPLWASLGTDFVRRQCDSLACDSGADNWFTGFFGGLLQWVDNSLDWGSSTTDDGKTELRIPDTPASAQSGDENFVQGEKLTGSERCQANAPLGGPGLQDTNSVSHTFARHCSSSLEFLCVFGRKVPVHFHADMRNSKLSGQNPVKMLLETPSRRNYWPAWMANT